MVFASDVRPGVTIQYEGGIYTVVDFQHVKPGKGSPFVRIKMKNLETGATTETSFRPEDKFENAIIEKKDMQYMYKPNGKFKGVWYKDKMYDRNGKQTLTRTNWGI